MEPCRYCQKPIVFIETAKGRRMPCESGPCPGTDAAPVLNESGELMKAGIGYLPHWKQCTRGSKGKRR